MKNSVACSRVPEAVYKRENDKSNPHGGGEARRTHDRRKETNLSGSGNKQRRPRATVISWRFSALLQGRYGCIRRCLCGQEAAATEGASSFGCYTHPSRGDDGCVRENAGKIHNCCNCTLLRLLWSTRKAASQAHTFLTPTVCRWYISPTPAAHCK